MSQGPNNSKAKCSALVPARTALVRAQSRDLPRYVTADEVRRACELEPRQEVRVFIRGLWLTGARISEWLAVKPADMDWQSRCVRLATLKRRRPTQRTIPLPPDFLGELVGLLNGSGLRSEERIWGWSRSRAFELIRDALLRAGVERPRAHPHCLRHGHAIHALAGGAPINAVQRSLGHALVSTTSIYLQVTADDLRRYYAAIEW